MYIDKWIQGCKVHVEAWIDGKTIYVNARYYRPGQSLSQAPVWDRTIYVTDDKNGRIIVEHFLDSLVLHICSMNYKDGNKYVVTVNSCPIGF